MDRGLAAAAGSAVASGGTITTWLSSMVLFSMVVLYAVLLRVPTATRSRAGTGPAGYPEWGVDDDCVTR
jgi:asparagine N-glycosylation enzyme membrane subunit Stt3